MIENGLNAKPHLDITQYIKWYQQSMNDPQTFWKNQAQTFIDWFTFPKKIISGSFENADVEWFSDGELNAAYNCIDRHLEKNADKIAIIWQGDDLHEKRKITYQELANHVNQFANVLLNLGIKKGDTVCIYMPMIPEAVYAMLACARIGAIHSVVFAGFSAISLQNRIQDAQCKLVITANVSIRGNKIIPLKENVDIALKDCPSVQQVIVIKRNAAEVNMLKGRDYWYEDLLKNAAQKHTAEKMKANDPLFILYTSGSTGKPKGILHGTGGYLVYAAMTFHYVFDYHPEDIFWCTADIGWITGHTYSVYGPLLNAATIVMFEGVPTYPTFSRYWEIIDGYQVSIFYTAPTAIRSLRQAGDTWVTKCSRKSLRILGTVGEPINPEVWEWYFDVVGDKRCAVVDTWWQTETGGIMISPLPFATPLKAGSATLPFFGVKPIIVDEKYKLLPANQIGRLMIEKPWPGMMLTIYHDHNRFKTAYFDNPLHAYLTGDEAHLDEDNYVWIVGRSDDVIKVSGHRIGTGEIESALVSHPAVAEAAVVAVPNAVKGQSIYAYVSLKENINAADDLKNELNNTVTHQIGRIASIEFIQFTHDLPKTRSGKIMRRLLRKIANDDTKELGDLSTLADPSVVEKLISEKLKIK